MQIIEKLKPTGLFTNYIYKAIPLAFDESMSYYETLLGLLDYLKNTVIPTVNNNADALIELQNLYNELHDYVEHYFDNLDVQQEINNKLDEMVESGQLDQIIEQYLNSSAIWGFDTVAEMKNASNLINGSFARTLGYHTKNDNGGALYKIRNITNDDTIDETTIIEITGDPQNNLIAELIIEKNTVTPEMFGAYGDNTHDDTSCFSSIINKYYTYQPKIKIVGRYDKKYIIESLVTNDIEIIDCNFRAKTQYVSNGMNMHSGTTLINCTFTYFYKAIYCEGTYNVFSEINRCTFQYNRFGIYFIGTTGTGIDYSTNDVKILNSYFVKNGTNVDDMSGASTQDNGYGIYIDNSFHNILIQGNLIEYNSFTGIYLNQTTSVHNNGCTIIGNYFEGNRDSAIYMKGSINTTHMIMITGNFYSSGTTNIRNTRYINVKNIFKSAYVMEDLYPITFNPRLDVDGVTNNANHTMTFGYGASQYQSFTPVSDKNDVYKLKFICNLDSNISILIGASGNQKYYQLTDGYNEINVYGQIPNNWYFSRALGEEETVTLLGSWSD